MGQYINDVGPQHTFVLPNGILRPHGHNTLAIAVITSRRAGRRPGHVKLVNLGTVATALSVARRRLAGLRRAAPDAVPLTLQAGPGLQRPGGDASTLPPDVLGAALDATIDWGDGTRLAGHDRRAAA